MGTLTKEPVEVVTSIKLNPLVVNIADVPSIVNRVGTAT